MNRRRGFLSFIMLAALLVLPYHIAGGKTAVSYNSDGWEYLRKGEDRRAVFSFRNALRINRNYEEAILGLARAYYGMGVHDEALGLFEKVQVMNPASGDALVWSGYILIEKGKFAQAMKLFDRALKISVDDRNAHYGIAYLYFSMNRMVWAKRKIESILAMDPYHFDTLLLLAEIKSREKRLSEAKELARKAIDSNNDSPRGYVRMAGIMFRDYVFNENSDSLGEALYNLKTALAVQPDSFKANRMMGDILCHEKDYGGAIEHYRRALEAASTPSLLYSLGVCYDKSGNQPEALKSFLAALKAAPHDEILNSRLEQYLMARDYKIGHPVRILRSEENLGEAKKRMRASLADDTIMYLRRTLLLNPTNREARESLMQYYQVLDYNRLFIDELKELNNFYPDPATRDRLSVAVIKRRNRLYHREGYSAETPQRDVPRILVMDFFPETAFNLHPDAGSVMANDLTLALQQFGRQDPLGLASRARVEGLRTDGDYFENSLEAIQSMIKREELPPVDYIVYGSYVEQENRIYLDLSVMDYAKGIVINNFSLTEEGRDNLLKLCLRSARRIYDFIPYKGRVLKAREDSIIVNLGLVDGVKPDSRLVIYKYSDGLRTSRITDRIIFTVKEADGDVCLAEPQNPAVLENIDSNDMVFPLERRRARMIAQ